MIGSVIALTLAGVNLPADPCASIPWGVKITQEEYSRRARECERKRNAKALAEVRRYQAETRPSNWFTFDECLPLDHRVFKCENDRFYAVWQDDDLVVFVENPTQRIR